MTRDQHREARGISYSAYNKILIIVEYKRYLELKNTYKFTEILYKLKQKTISRLFLAIEITNQNRTFKANSSMYAFMVNLICLQCFGR